MWEIRRLAHAVFEALPDDHKYLFESFVEKEEQ
jgi:thymidylate synthase ThyX